MDIETILHLLRNERTRIDEAISAIEKLNSNSRNLHRTPGPRGIAARGRSGRARMSAAARKRLSDLLKKRWASGKMGSRKARKAA